jgi:hypothetical protein
MIWAVTPELSLANGRQDSRIQGFAQVPRVEQRPKRAPRLCRLAGALSEDVAQPVAESVAETGDDLVCRMAVGQA